MKPITGFACALRGNAELAIRAELLRFDTDVFVSEDGAPLSDHDPLAVRFAWSATKP